MAQAHLSRRIESRPPSPPAWIERFVPKHTSRIQPGSPSADRIRLTQGKSWSYANAALEDACDLSPEDFESAAQQIISALLHAIGKTDTPHPVRFWTHIPDIHHQPAQEPIDRYMRFNAGRFAAFAAWYGQDAARAGRIPTASAVGHHGNDLTIHLLASHNPGQPIENPRQVPSFRYSQRYGPLPPCFARATRVCDTAGHPWLLVAGTASVVGEESRHSGDLAAQLDETCRNLATLVRVASQEPGVSGASPQDGLLRSYRHVRVYYVRVGDRAWLEQHAATRFAGAQQIEWVHADLCRRDLLVEIEGLARLSEDRDGR